MKFRSPFSDLSRFELGLWLGSVIIITLSFLFPEEKDYLTLIASLIGVTALIFVAKGYVLGQVLTVVFAVFYGIISVIFGYSCHDGYFLLHSRCAWKCQSVCQYAFCNNKLSRLIADFFQKSFLRLGLRRKRRGSYYSVGACRV